MADENYQLDQDALKALPGYLQSMVTNAVAEDANAADLGAVTKQRLDDERKEFTEKFNTQARELQRAQTDFFNQTMDEQVAINTATKEIEGLQQDREDIFAKQEEFLKSKEFLANKGIINENDQFIVNRDALIDKLLDEKATTAQKEEYAANLKTFGERVDAQESLAKNINELEEKLKILADIKNENGEIKPEIKEFLQSDGRFVSTQPLEEQIIAYKEATQEQIRELKEEQKKFTDAEAYLLANVSEENKPIVENLLAHRKSEMKADDFQNKIGQIDADIEARQETIRTNQDAITAIAEKTTRPKEDALNDTLAEFSATKKHFEKSGTDENLNSVRTYISSRITASEGPDKNDIAKEYAKVVADNAERAGGASGLLESMRNNDKLKGLAPQKVSRTDFGMNEGEPTAGDMVRLHFYKEGNDTYVQMKASRHGKNGVPGEYINKSIKISEGGVDLSDFKNSRVEISADANMNGENVALMGMNDENPAKFIGKGFAYTTAYRSRIKGENGRTVGYGEVKRITRVDSGKDDLANPDSAFDVVGSNKNADLLTDAGKAAEKRSETLYLQEKVNLAKSQKANDDKNASLQTELEKLTGKSYENTVVSDQETPKKAGGFDLAAAAQAAKSGLIPKNSEALSAANANQLGRNDQNLAQAGGAGRTRGASEGLSA